MKRALLGIAATAAISRSGSTAVLDVVPTVAHT